MANDIANDMASLDLAPCGDFFETLLISMPELLKWLFGTGAKVKPSSPSRVTVTPSYFTAVPIPSSKLIVLALSILRRSNFAGASGTSKQDHSNDSTHCIFRSCAHTFSPCILGKQSWRGRVFFLGKYRAQRTFPRLCNGPCRRCRLPQRRRSLLRWPQRSQPRHQRFVEIFVPWQVLGKTPHELSSSRTKTRSLRRDVRLKRRVPGSFFRRSKCRRWFVK
jgi:hypothetical protein